MSPRQAEAFLERLLEWLNRRLAPPGVIITSETEIFASRIIDSIRILDLIAWTEREIGVPVPDRMIALDNFRTPRRIAEIFALVGADVVR